MKGRGSYLARLATLPAVALAAVVSCQPTPPAMSSEKGDAAHVATHDAGERDAIPAPAPAAPPPAYEPYSEPFVPEAKRLEKLALAGDGNAAIELADWILSSNGLPPDATRAASLLDGACKRSVQDACGRLAMLYLMGDGVAENRGHATALLDAACAAGSAWSCARIGGERLYGTHIRADVERGAKEARDACEGGSVWGCEVLLNAMARELIPKDAAARTRALDRKVANVKNACERAASPPRGQGLRRYDCFEWFTSYLRREKDDERVVEGATELLCAAGSWHDCINTKDQKLFDSREQACKRGDTRACNIFFEGSTSQCRLGNCNACYDEADRRDESTSPLSPEMNASLERACSLGCMNACRTWFRRSGTLATQAERRTKACDRGLASACFEAGEAESNDEKARVFYERSCPETTRYVDKPDLSARGCMKSGDIHRVGRGQSRDMARARAFYERGCFASTNETGRAWASCRYLGELEESRPWPDHERALAYYAAACEPGEWMGDWESCLRMRELITRHGIPRDPEQRKRIIDRLTTHLFEERRNNTVVDGGYR